MKSLRELLILGPGPSSSHTIGPYRIALAFQKECEGLNVCRYEFTLMGSLGCTGKGHSTDRILAKAFPPETPVKVFFFPSFEELKHPNTMECRAYSQDGKLQKMERYLSIGGGAIQKEDGVYDPKDVYPFSTFAGLKAYLKERKTDDPYDVIEALEGETIFSYGKERLSHSFSTIEESLKKTSTLLPGPLHLKAVSGEILRKAYASPDPSDRRDMFLTAYAYATAEANARGEEIVTAPTCGAAGVVPAVLFYEKEYYGQSLEALVKAYLVGALVCNFIKANAGISGALLGCQAEIGSASSFAAASLAYLDGLTLHQVEYAAEVAMEHFLGLTCDPVDGYVQIPCIERNGMAAIHAYASYLYSKNIAPYRRNRVSFDKVVEAMSLTGSEIPSDLKETGQGGLAKVLSKGS